jgi:hypothetical protein
MPRYDFLDTLPNLYNSGKADKETRVPISSGVVSVRTGSLVG